jgi:predicted GNAT superfamily acetyltransferase
MYSAIMGVAKAYQGLGIGYRLKLAQREFALRIGVRLVTWTYDPLESRNAYLNFSKLGVICHNYYRNFHGELGGINVGLPTDRFYVEWWITSNRVNGKISKKRSPLGIDAYRDGGAVLVNPVDQDINDLPIPRDEFIRSKNKLLMVEIPSQLQQIKLEDMSLARRWRLHAREIFEYYFDHNYLVTDLVLEKRDSHISTCYYILSSADS